MICYHWNVRRPIIFRMSQLANGIFTITSLLARARFSNNDIACYVNANFRHASSICVAEHWLSCWCWKILVHRSLWPALLARGKKFEVSKGSFGSSLRKYIGISRSPLLSFLLWSGEDNGSGAMSARRKRWTVRYRFFPWACVDVLNNNNQSELCDSPSSGHSSCLTFSGRSCLVLALFSGSLPASHRPRGRGNSGEPPIRSRSPFVCPSTLHVHEPSTELSDRRPVNLGRYAQRSNRLPLKLNWILT